MDNKTIALIGALLVLGVAIYGMATGNLPGTGTMDESDNGGDDAGNTNDGPPGDTSPGDSGGSNGGGAGGSDDGGGNETEMATNETGNVTAPEPEPEPLPIVCEDQGSDFSPRDLEVASSDPLNTRLAESIIHDRLNEIRVSRADGVVDPFKCDPVLREIARDHSQLILIQEGARGNEQITSDYQESQERIRELGGELELDDNLEDLTRDEVEVNETRMFDGVCGENYVIEEGQFAYEVNIEGGDSGDISFGDSPAADFADDQELTRIDDEEDLARDVRRLFVDSDSVEDQIIDESMTRQGIGIATDRSTNEVVVTVIHCGPRSDQTQEQSP